MVVLGLTGSIGMGKTTVAGAFRAAGAAVYDADAVVHRLLGPGGAGVASVRAAFPGAARDGGPASGIDRRALAAQVFADADALTRLESLLHPLVRAGERGFLLACRHRGCRLAVLDVPLLFETGGEMRCDATVVVSAPGFVQRARVMRRGRMTEAQLSAILARQLSDQDKRRRADFVISTGLDRRVARLAVRRVAARVLAHRGACWPRCWPASPGPTGGGHA